MWIFLTDSFMSIVQDREDPDLLLVRARRAGDIEAVFPGAEVQFTRSRDYRYRTRIPRAEVAAAIARRIEAIDYPNFKNTVQDRERHHAYTDVWTVMYGYQLQEKPADKSPAGQ